MWRIGFGNFNNIVLPTLVRGKGPLDNNEMIKFKAIVEHFKEDIVQKWIDFFLLNKEIKAERITQKIK